MHNGVIFCVLLCLASVLAVHRMGGPKKYRLQSAVLDADLVVAKQFDEWMVQHQKTYSNTEEKVQRLENFKASLQRINKSNKASKGATFGLNQFSDMTTEEFKATVLMKPVVPPTQEAKAANLLKTVAPKAAPQTFDWRDHKAVTAVKDQGQCGSCWAFSATENIESVWMLANKISNTTMTTLSPQQIVDCDDSDHGCAGGFPYDAFAYVINAGGLDSAKSYPYTAEDGNCAFKQADVVSKISSWNYVIQDGDENEMASKLSTTAPLSVCVDASNWQDYQSGVLTAWECAWINTLDHCVQAVGYNQAASSPYWIVRNSWGTSWGINGYIWLEFGANTCGITNMVTTSVAA